MPLQSHLAVPVKSIIGTGDFLYMLIKWLYLFWELPGLSMAVTDSFHKLTYFFHGICRNLCFHSSWLFLLLLFPLSPLTHPPPYHIWKISFWHIWKWQELWEVLSAPEFLCMFSDVNILVWDCPCLKYLLPVSVVAFTQIKSTSAFGSLGKGRWAVFWQLCIERRWLHECIFCLTQYINHNAQFLPNELEWIKLFNKTLLTWINSFIFCI